MISQQNHKPRAVHPRFLSFQAAPRCKGSSTSGALPLCLPYEKLVVDFDGGKIAKITHTGEEAAGEAVHNVTSHVFTPSMGFACLYEWLGNEMYPEMRG